MIDYTLLKQDSRFMDLLITDVYKLWNRLEQNGGKLLSESADWTEGLEGLVTTVYVNTSQIVCIEPLWSYKVKWAEIEEEFNLEFFYVLMSTGKKFYAVDLVDDIGKIEMKYDNGIIPED